MQKWDIFIIHPSLEFRKNLRKNGLHVYTKFLNIFTDFTNILKIIARNVISEWELSGIVT